jgi:hypothetical protein
MTRIYMIHSFINYCYKNLDDTPFLSIHQLKQYCCLSNDNNLRMEGVPLMKTFFLYMLGIPTNIKRLWINRKILEANKLINDN